MPGSTSSTSTAGTRTCRSSSSRPSTTSAPTSTAARSRTGRASGWRPSRPCARRSATTARSPYGSASRHSGRPGSSCEEGLGFVRLADHLVDLWDVNVGSIIELVEGLGRVAVLPGGLPAAMDGPRARGDGEADRRRRPASRTPTDGRDHPRAAPRHRSARRGPRSPTRSSPRRSRRAVYDEIRECIGCNICVSRRPRRATTSAAPRTRPPARSTAAAGTPSGSSRPRTATATCSSSARARRAWSARSCSESAASAACTSSRPRPKSAASCAGCPRLPGLGEWGRVLNWRSVQLAKLGNVEVITGARLSAQDVREYGAEIVIVATGSRWAGDGLNFVTHEPIPGADASLAHVLTPEQVMLEGKTPSGRARARLRRRGLLHGRRASRRSSPRRGTRSSWSTPHERIAPICDETLEGPLLRQHLHEARSSRRTGTTLTGIEPARVTRRDEFGERGRVGRGRGRARHPAPLRRRALPRAEGGSRDASPTRASRRSTGSATASRRASSPRRSSTATGSPARSMPRTRRCRSRTRASGSCSSR